MLVSKSFPWSKHEGFVVAGCHVTATKLLAGLTVTVWGDDTLLGRLSLTPDAEGNADKQLWFASPLAPDELWATVNGDLTFSDPSGYIRIEAAELLEYQPQPWDEYLVTRCATANGAADPQGPDYTAAADIVPSLLTEGCLLGNELAIQPDSITGNPLYQAWRRLSRLVRFVARDQLLSYAVDAEGVATLRFARALAGRTLEDCDPWEGIAPPISAIPSGELVKGETYIVRGTAGAVTYAGTAYAVDATFTAAADTTYTAAGDAAPWVEDGIKHLALEKGWTNEWVFILQTHCYRDLETSIWKPSIYADFFTFGAPEHFYSPSSGALRDFVNSSYSFSVPDESTYTSELSPAMVQATFINPEAPSAYTYGAGANASASSGFKSSRQVYPMPYEPDSCTIEFDGSGNQIVVLKLVARLRYHPNAPATIASDPATWSADDLARLDGTHATYPQDWRTDENALCEYLRLMFGDGHPCSFKVGDCGAGGSPYPTADGNCFPNFIFAKLVPECFEDGNDTIETADSRVLAETYEHAGLVLDTICEAFVAGSTSAERVCLNTGYAGLYDYTREALYFEAFADRSLSAFPLSVRADGQFGFGPLPNTELYADSHNRLAKAYNLLTRLRLDVPLLWETRERWYTGELAITPTGNPVGYCDSAVRQAWLDAYTPPPAATLTYDSDWMEATSPPVLHGFQGAGLACCGGTADWCLSTFRTDWDWRVSIQPDWLLAVPAHIQSLVAVNGLGTVAVRQELRFRHTRVDEDPRSVCDGLAAAYQWRMDTLTETQTCVAVLPGHVAADVPPSGDYAVWKPTAGSDPCEYGSEHSIVYSLLAHPGAYIEVPLVDLP